MTGPLVPADDRGLLLGDGLFETILAVDGEPRFFDRHLDRMRRGCAVLSMAAPDPASARQAAVAALGGAGLTSGRAALRLTLTAGSGRGLDRPASAAPRLFATASPAPAPVGPARLVTSQVRRNELSPVSRLKSLSYLDSILARAEARAAGADEALVLNTRGEVACAAAANLFWIRGERLFTPALDCGVLEGIVRGRVLGAAEDLGVEVCELHALPERLTEADGMFLTSSLIGLRQVGELDGRAFAGHPLIAALSSRCS